MAISGLLGSIVGGLAEGGLSSGGGYGSAKYAYKLQRRIMKHAVSWRVQDMKRAGINPIMAVNPGGGASGSAPSGRDPRVPLTEALRSSSQRSLQAAQVKAAQAQADAGLATAQNQGALARLHGAQAEKEQLTKLPYEILNSAIRSSAAKDISLQSIMNMYRDVAEGGLSDFLGWVLNEDTPEGQRAKAKRAARKEQSGGR